MSVFVLDYDHNAPDVAHLKATHEPFFLRVREKNPDLPIVLMTRPNDVQDPMARLAVVKETYENALARGDKNVYFINGRDFFGEEDHAHYTIDGVHPNDLGFDKMTQLIEPVIRKILEKK
jgi:lysophospholipase L1-like esterase